MLRNTLLYLSNQPRVFKFVRNNRLAKNFAKRFVAGETLDEALDAVRALNARGITASLDLLGESVNNEREARAARDEYLAHARPHPARRGSTRTSRSSSRRWGSTSIRGALRRASCRTSSTRAQQYGTFVRIDMEASEYTEHHAQAVRGAAVPVVQGATSASCCRATCIAPSPTSSARTRSAPACGICKGAYKEPPSVAYPEKKDVDADYVKCMQRAHAERQLPRHRDARPGDDRRGEALGEGAGDRRDRFEFQMLYGVRRDLQEALVREGYRMRVYVPFGTQWYPYLMRRLAERPANVAFITGNIDPRSAARSPALARDRMPRAGTFRSRTTRVATPTPSAATPRCTAGRPPSRGATASRTASRSWPTPTGRSGAAVGRVPAVRAVGAHRRGVAERTPRDRLPRRVPTPRPTRARRRRAAARRGDARALHALIAERRGRCAGAALVGRDARRATREAARDLAVRRIADRAPDARRRAERDRRRVAGAPRRRRRSSRRRCAAA